MIASPPALPSLNEASDKDPFNNNCYGTTIDRSYKSVQLPVLNVEDFNERIIRGYEEGYGEQELPADLSLARSLIPAGTASLRDFSYISPEIPKYIPENCTGCMDCVTECPDTAILGKVLGEDAWEQKLLTIPEADRAAYRAVVQDEKILRWRQEESGWCRRDVPDHHRPLEVQRLRGMRYRLRRRCAQDGFQNR